MSHLYISTIKKFFKNTACTAAFLFVCLQIAMPGALKAESAISYTPQQELVDNAYITFKTLMADPNMTWLRSHIQSAKGILICPKFMKGAFLFGADGGTGVLLGRSDRTGEWSYPAFYGLGSISFGLQAGAQVSEVVLLVMTEKGMDALLSTSFKLGADASVAAGPVGAGAKAQTTDILAFAKTAGLFGGISIEGAIITARDSWNQKYYGRDVRPVDIIIRRNVANPGADKLRLLIAKTVQPENPAPLFTPPPLEEELPATEQRVSPANLNHEIKEEEINTQSRTLGNP